MLEVTGIEKRYRGRTILKNVSFRANPGECIGIVGGNGCGKTTLLSILAGIRKPDRGSIRIDGQEALGRHRLLEEKIAYVPQENPLIGAVIASLIYQLFVFSVDYSRTEYTQFEDDDYYYYVKAVPKIAISRTDVKVQEINKVKRR